MKQLNGKRLAYIREQLSAKEPEGRWSQARVAEATGLKQNMIARMEANGAGSIEALLSLLLFYNEKGFNIRWILIEDNSGIPLLNSEVEEKSTSRVFMQSIKQQLDNFLGEE